MSRLLRRKKNLEYKKFVLFALLRDLIYPDDNWSVLKSFNGVEVMQLPCCFFLMLTTEITFDLAFIQHTYNVFMNIFHTFLS